MARTGGGMFNTLMKSGTNTYHGSVYGHLRRTAWDANSFFNNAGDVPITSQPNDTWGASFGGAVRIPKLYNGTNKTFFYLGFEHYDDIQSSSSVFATPTALEKTGNFSQSLNSGGSLDLIYDPMSVVNGARQPFPGNVIPSTRLNPTGLAMASFFQPPTTAARILRRQRPECSRKAALPRRAVYRQARRGFLHLVARQRELPALFLAGARQHRVSQ